MRIKGNAALVYGATTHDLAAPIRVLRYRELGRRWTRERLNRSAVDRTALAVAAYEIDALLPYNDEPAALLAALRSSVGAGTTLSYRPDVDDADYAFGLLPIDVGDAIEVAPDRALGRGFKRWEIGVRFRGVGSDLVGLIVGRLVLVEDAVAGWRIQIGGTPDAYFVEDSVAGWYADPIPSSGAAIRQSVGYQVSV